MLEYKQQKETLSQVVFILWFVRTKTEINIFLFICHFNAKHIFWYQDTAGNFESKYPDVTGNQVGFI